jgi:hypothetical protein
MVVHAVTFTTEYAPGVSPARLPPPNSNAPTSQALWPGAGRITPRWSVAGQFAAEIASIAGLPDCSAIV